MGLTIILPAFNEEENIEQTVAYTHENLRARFDEFEILVIDDASRDATGVLADRLAERYAEVRVVHNEVNLRQGGSLLRGFREARFDLVTHNGMDMPFDVRDLDKMLPLMDEADVVVAARMQRPGYTIYRKFISHINVALMNLLFPLHLHDYSFVQLYRKPVLDAIEVDARSQGFVIPETLVRAHDKGFRIREVRIEYHAREHGVPTSGNPRIVWNSFAELVRFWWRRRRRR